MADLNMRQIGLMFPLIIIQFKRQCHTSVSDL